jgi:hypothetical protein
VRAIVDAAVAEVAASGAEGGKAMGAVMKIVQPQVKGRADGGQVAALGEIRAGYVVAGRVVAKYVIASRPGLLRLGSLPDPVARVAQVAQVNRQFR